jgi:hypothetical protein
VAPHPQLPKDYGQPKTQPVEATANPWKSATLAGQPKEIAPSAATSTMENPDLQVYLRCIFIIQKVIRDEEFSSTIVTISSY